MAADKNKVELQPRPLPEEPFFAGVQCFTVRPHCFDLKLGEHKVRAEFTAASFKLFYLEHGKRRQRSLGVHLDQSAIEGAVCYLRHIQRGGGAI